MTKSELGVLRRQVEQFRKALKNGTVFEGFGRDPKSKTDLEVKGGWRPLIVRLTAHLDVQSPLTNDCAKVSTIWDLTDKAEIFLGTVKAESSCHVTAIDT